MEAVNILMKLFKLMDEEEKKETVRRIGDDLDDEGLTDRWTTTLPGEKSSPGKASSSKTSKKKRKGSYRPFWMKHVESINLKKRGMDKISGGWVKADDVAKLPDRSKILLGIKGGDYLVCIAGAGLAKIEDSKGIVHLVEDMATLSRHEKFNDAIDAIIAGM